eukprot:GHUV01004200.1.p1 GENE.GHUV01004200.1~~GHUV01004200.1.p1  ORF type:complete len:146 (+),score=15.43 GHUV01004200.1:262-699(+)
MQPVKATRSPSTVFPLYSNTISEKHIRRGLYLTLKHAPAFVLLPLAASLVLELGNMVRTGELIKLWSVASQTDLTFNLVTVVICCSVLLAAILSFFLLQTRPVYLVDFSVYKPPDSWMVPAARFLDCSRASKARTGGTLLQFGPQ